MVWQIARFKDLTEEQKAILLAANKASGKYTDKCKHEQLEALLK